MNKILNPANRDVAFPNSVYSTPMLHRLRDLRLRRGIHVQRTPGGQNWFAKSDQVVLMWKNNLRGRSRKSRGVRACVSARHAAFPQGRNEGGRATGAMGACMHVAVDGVHPPDFCIGSFVRP